MQTGTLTGTYQSLNGTPAKGNISISSNPAVVKDPTGNVIFSSPTVLTLDAQGSFTVTLPATDDATLNPTGFTYTVTSTLNDRHIRSVTLDLAGGVTRDMADVLPVDPAAPAYAAPVSSVDGRTGAIVLSDLYATVGEVRSLVKTDGTDQTAVLQAELDALRTAGGGTLVLPEGTITLNGTLTLSNDGAVPPKQPAIRIVGQGCHFSGRGTAIVGGTVLDIKGTATYGKILTTGLGLLAVSGVTFTDTSGDATPFIYTTQTTLHVDQCAFVGSKTGALCDQDAIILGGTVAQQGGGDPTWGFQGYGTVISRNFFHRIRRGVYGRVFSNATVVRDNTWWSTCGFPTGSAIEYDGDPLGDVQYATGNLFVGNLIEVTNYGYAIKLRNATQNQVIANHAYDDTATCQAAVWFDGRSNFNLLIDGFFPGTLPGILETGLAVGTNTRIAHGQSVTTTFSQPVTFTHDLGVEFPKLVKMTGGSVKFVIQPATNQLEGAAYIRGLRSAADDVNPGGPVFDITQDGFFKCFNSAGAQWNFGPGRIEAATVGGTLTISSGTGGSYLDLKNYGVRFYDHNAGPLRVRVGAGKDGFDLGSASDVTVQRDASGQLAVNKAVTTQAATTAGRPTASSAGAGAQIYDTTLSKPIWSDGTNWRDAAGTIV